MADLLSIAGSANTAEISAYSVGVITILGVVKKLEYVINDFSFGAAEKR